MLRVVRQGGGIVEIVIDHPPVNAFAIGLLHDLAAALDAIADDPDARVVMIRSEGRGFCGGGDIKEVAALPGCEGILGQAGGAFRAIKAILDCAVPVIVGVHGYCIGVGVLIAGAADIVVASAQSRFVLAEIDNGATAGGILALRLMPEKRVRSAMMTAEPIYAEEIQGYGTLHRLVSESELVSTMQSVGESIAQKPAEAMRRLKRALYHSMNAAGIEAAYRAEVSYTYELNMIGTASLGREAFFSGKRASYLADPDKVG